MTMYPSLYQVNTRVWLRDLANTLGRPAGLADIPDSFLDQAADLGFDYVWFLGLWQTGQAGRQVSLSHPEWLQEFQVTLPNFTEADISGSPFAVTGYTLNQNFGPEANRASLKERLQKRKLKLMVDFVPNHTAPDHPWVKQHPEFYVQGSPADLEREPHNYRRVETANGSFTWPTAGTPTSPAGPTPSRLTSPPGLREAMAQELLRLAGIADGVAVTWPVDSPEFFSAPGASGLCPATVPTVDKPSGRGPSGGQGQEPGLYFHGGSLLGYGVDPHAAGL